MDKITIQNKEYDPYFILDVSIDDTDEHITQAFYKKAKKYHPDRAPKGSHEKYTRYFNVIRECYEYIKSKRAEQIVLTKREKQKKLIQKDEKNFTKDELKKFNKSFEKENPNDFGYGNQERIKSIKDYEDQQIEIVKQMDEKKYTNEEFNLLFEYTKQLNEQQEPASKALVHKTTDGFFGYNTSDLPSCSMVSSYNGLLITGDNFGESGVGYWSNNYGDYKQSFNSSKNPQQKIKVPSSFKESYTNKPETTFNASKYKKDYDSFTPIPSGNYNAEQEKLLRTTLDQLMEKEESDKQMFMKYKHQYDENTIKQALDGRLETSPTLLQNLGGHFKQLRMG
jgi:curved DNA-binding protein CbpA